MQTIQAQVAAAFAALPPPRRLLVAGPGSMGGPGVNAAGCVRLLCCLEGDADHILYAAGRQRLQAVRPGEVLLAPAGHPIAAGPGAAVMATLILDGDTLLARRRERGREPAATLAWRGDEAAPVLALGRALLALLPCAPTDRLALDTLALLLRHAGRLLARGCASLPGHDPFAAACRLIADDLAAPLDRATVAAAVDVHPNHLSRLFRQRTGAGFARHLAELRLERAERLLREGLLTVGETARAVGFASAGVFAQTCRRLRGRPPSALG